MSEPKVYEMQWDCQYCGTEKLLGKTHRFCPNCGAPQNPDARYYPSDDEKVAVQDHKFVGKDITCPACDHLNSGASKFCEQCGSPLEKGTQAATLAAQMRDDDDTFESSGSRDVVKEKFESEMERVGLDKGGKRKKGGTPWVWIIGGVLACAAILAVIYMLTAKQESTLVVAELTWQRDAVVEQYQEYSVRSWEDTRPPGINMVIVPGSCEREQRSTRRVPDGEECQVRRVDQGDGTFREEEQCQTVYREEPVYDQMCVWNGFIWDYARTVSTSGTGTEPEPYWGELNLRCDGEQRVGCERVASQEEAYTVHFRGDENRAYDCNFPQSEWQSIPIESVWTGLTGTFNTDAIDCDSLQRQ